MRPRRAVITGIGVVNPAGIGASDFWSAVSAGESAIRSISRFDASSFPAQVAGEIRGFKPEDHVPRRQIIRTDRFTHYAMAAAAQALGDAGLDLEKTDRDRVGVWFGNDTGGWDIHEQGLFELYRQGPKMVNPWQATSWFPTSAQGHTSIRHRLLGDSKSFVGDRASGAAALFFALRSIRQGNNHVVLTGGTEAPLTPLGLACHFGTGELAAAREPAGAYRPFDRERAGLVLGEGAAVLVLEDAEHAAARGAVVHGELLSACITTDAGPGSGRALAAAMRKAISSAGLAPRDIDLVLAEGCGTREGDRVEAAAIAEVLGADAGRVPVTVPRSAYGHLFGASTATEIVCGLLAAKTGRIPPISGLDSPDPGCPLSLVRRPRAGTVSRFLVNARSREGINASLVVTAA